MIHWGFLILAFVAGAATCYGILYQLTKIYGQVTKAAREGTQEARIQE